MRIYLFHQEEIIGNWIQKNVAKKKAMLTLFARKAPAVALLALIIATGIAAVSALILITRAVPAATNKAKAKTATDYIKNAATSAQIILIQRATCRPDMSKALVATAVLGPNIKPVVIQPTNTLAPAATKAKAPASLVMVNINRVNASQVMIGTPQPALATSVVIRLINLIASKAPAPTSVAATALPAIVNINAVPVHHLTLGAAVLVPAPQLFINILAPAPATPADGVPRVTENMAPALVPAAMCGKPIAAF